MVWILLCLVSFLTRMIQTSEGAEVESESQSSAAISLRGLLRDKIATTSETTWGDFDSYFSTRWTAGTVAAVRAWYDAGRFPPSDVKGVGSCDPQTSVISVMLQNMQVLDLKCAHCGNINAKTYCLPWQNEVCLSSTGLIDGISMEAFCHKVDFFSPPPGTTIYQVDISTAFNTANEASFPENGAIMNWGTIWCVFNVERSTNGLQTCTVDWIQGKFLSNPDPDLTLSAFLAIYNYHPNDKGTTLLTDARLQLGQYIRSPNYRYQAILETNGNFAVYDHFRNKKLLWSSQTGGMGYKVLFIQGNEDVGLYDSTTHRPASLTRKWVNTNSPIQVKFVMQNDGNLVLYRVSDGRPIWAIWGNPWGYALGARI